MTASVIEWVRKRPYVVIGSLTVLAHILVAIVRTRGTWFFADDFQNLMLAADAQKPLSHMLEPVFGQYVPLYRATNLVLINQFGLSFTPWLAILLLCSATAVSAIMWICARQRLPALVTAAVGAFLACTWLPLEGQAWWSAGLHILPGGAAVCVCLAISARPAAKLGLVHSLILAAILGAGIAYYNAVLLVLGPVIMVRWYVSTQEQADAPVFKRATRTLIDLLPTLVVAALTIAAIAWLDADRTGTSPPDELALSTLIGLTYGTGAGIAGVRSFGDATPDADLIIWGIIGGAMLIGTTMVSIVRSRRTAWLWLGFWSFALLQLWIIASERLPTFGEWVTVSPRYNLSNVLVFFGIACIAFGQRYPARDLAPAALPRWVFAGSAALGLIAFSVSHLVTGGGYGPREEIPPQQSFVRQMTATAPGGSVSVGNRTLPDVVTPHWTGGFATLQTFRSIAPVELQLTPWTRATHFLADDGSLTTIASQQTETWILPGGDVISPHVLPPMQAAGEVLSLQKSKKTTLTGWVNPLIAEGSAAAIVAVTPAKIVIAGHIGLPSANAIAAFRMREFATAGFEIDLPPGVEPQEARVFLLLGDTIAAPMPMPEKLGEVAAAFPSANASDAAQPLVIADVTLSKAFSENGWYSSSPAPMLPGRGFGSWAPQGDAGQGETAVTLDLPLGLAAIAVPILTGPTAKGMRYSVTDAATGAIIAELKDLPPIEAWRFWAVELPAGLASPRIVVRVEDQSAEWGAWAALGPVYALKPPT